MLLFFSKERKEEDAYPSNVPKVLKDLIEEVNELLLMLLRDKIESKNLTFKIFPNCLLPG